MFWCKLGAVFLTNIYITQISAVLFIFLKTIHLVSMLHGTSGHDTWCFGMTCVMYSHGTFHSLQFNLMFFLVTCLFYGGKGGLAPLPLVHDLLILMTYHEVMKASFLDDIQHN